MDLIDRARELIQEKGWIQGAEYRSPEIYPGFSGYCIRGALKQANRELLRANPFGPNTQWTVCERAIGRVLQRRRAAWVTVPEWNDKDARNVDEVLEVMKLASEDMDNPPDGRRQL